MTTKAAGRRRWRRLGLGAAVLLLLAAGAWVRVRESLAPGSWARVERRDLVIGVEVEGELESIDSADIGPPQVPDLWDFKIAMMVPEGTEVEEGQPVLRFDTTLLERQLQDKIAGRDAAQKELEKRVTDFEISRRNQELQLAEARASLRKADLQLAVPADVARRKELEQAAIDRRLAEMRIDYLEQDLGHLAVRRRADLEALRGQRDRGLARVDEIQLHLREMNVRAPRAGTVIYKTNWRGEKKKIGDSAWRAEKILEIPDLRRLRAEGQVAEADAGRLAAGQRVTFRLDAYPDAEYAGTVSRIRRAVQRKSRSNPEKVVRLEIELAAIDVLRMRPGMRLRGTVEVERVADTLVVPAAAVFPGPGGSAVTRRTLFGRQPVRPQFGRRNGEVFEVVSGLAEGDRVLRRGGEEGS